MGLINGAFIIEEMNERCVTSMKELRNIMFLDWQRACAQIVIESVPAQELNLHAHSLDLISS